MTGLAAAQAALEQGEWQEALDALATLDPLPPEALDVRAMALYALGDFEGCVASWEQLHARRSATGERTEAARAAVMVAMFLLIDSGLMAPIRGWLGRARKLLADEPVGPVHALVATVHGYERFFSGDVDAARLACPDAMALGEEHGVAPAVAIGRTLHARLMLVDGDITGGLQALDEVGTYLMSNEVDALTVGMMLCEIVCAAQSLSMPELAREWTDVMEHWGRQGAVGGINGRCRVHRAELLRQSGPCDAAEAEALAACDALRPWMRREFGWPLVELGNVRLRKGDLAGAEESYLEADGLTWSPQPGLALLRLAQGKADEATTMIDEAVAHPPALPWKERPPAGDLQLAALLDAQAEIAAATGDAARCGAAAERLTEIAARYPSKGLESSATLARARAALLSGRFDTARELGTDAARLWAELDAPFDAAAARVVVGDALAASGDADGAAHEWETAQRSYAAFGAVGRADGLAGRRGAPRPVDTSHGTFRRDGAVRVVERGGAAVSLPDLVGFRYIERLLAHPGQELASTDLVAAERGDGYIAQAGIPALDDEARDAYRRRLTEVDDDITEAEEMNDVVRAELARRDRDYLIAELSRAVGLSGRMRTVGGDAERARTSVFRAVRYAVDRLAEQDADVAEHLRRSISTGTWCRYAPDPLLPVTWATN